MVQAAVDAHRGRRGQYLLTGSQKFTLMKGVSESLAGRLFFWRDRTREVDFVAEAGGRLELFEAKWTELPAAADTVNLGFVREVVGKSRIADGAVVCPAPNSFPPVGRVPGTVRRGLVWPPGKARYR